MQQQAGLGKILRGLGIQNMRTSAYILYLYIHTEGDPKMIHVIASIYVKKGRLAEFIKIFKSNIPNVFEEKGCLEYMPTIDVPTGFPL